MRLRILEDGAWAISEMREIEVYLLRQIGKAADASDCDSARARLFPDRAVEGAPDAGGAGSTRDWRELVVPELKEQFRGALDCVRDDLDRVQAEAGERGEQRYSVRIPAAHADHWYSALNQARLVLAERFDLPMSESEYIDEPGDVDARWLANAQSNLYAFVQTFLLETVMRM